MYPARAWAIPHNHSVPHAEPSDVRYDLPILLAPGQRQFCMRPCFLHTQLQPALPDSWCSAPCTLQEKTPILRSGLSCLLAMISRCGHASRLHAQPCFAKRLHIFCSMCSASTLSSRSGKPRCVPYQPPRLSHIISCAVYLRAFPKRRIWY